MTVVTYNQNSIVGIEAEWNALSQGKDMTFFQTFAWNTLLKKQFSRQILRRIYRKLCYVCVYDENELKLIAPLRVRKLYKGGRLIQEIELLGADSFSDYVNLIYNQIDDAVLDALFEFLENNWPGYVLFWKDIPQESYLAGYLSRKYGKHTSMRSKSIVIPLHFESFDEYFMSLSKSTRQNYRTSCNRMARDEVSFRIEAFMHLQDDTFIDQLMQINYDRTIEKNNETFRSPVKRMKEKFILKYNNIVRDMIKGLENSWVLVTYINDVPAGFFAGVATEDTIHVMMNKVKPEFGFYSPMIVTAIQYLEQLFQSRAIKVLDFGRGTEQYKYKLGGTEVDLMQLEMLL